MIGIVEGVEEIAVERVNILEFREAVEDGLQFLGEGLGGIFNFSSIKLCNCQPTSSLYTGVRRTARILLIWKPERICVGRRRWVLLSTMSRNSVELGTGAISFQVVFMVNGGWRGKMYWTFRCRPSAKVRLQLFFNVNLGRKRHILCYR
jgi:hypothetical protein